MSVEELASLDCVLWQRTGKQAARALGCNESTISRRLGRCVEGLELKMMWVRKGRGSICLLMV